MAQSLSVERLYRENWKRFLDWQTQTQFKHTLSMPEEVADVFIPKKILEFAQDPNRVRVLLPKCDLTNESSEAIRVLIYEGLDSPITDSGSFNAWQQSVSGMKALAVPSSQAEAPEGIDYKHTHYRDFINKGSLTFCDKVYLDYFADIYTGYPDLVVTRNYYDRSELQGNGIGTSFYVRLEDILRQLGFKYLAGTIVSPHPGFFRRQRIQYGDLDPEQRKLFPSSFAGRNNNYMIKFL